MKVPRARPMSLMPPTTKGLASARVIEGLSAGRSSPAGSRPSPRAGSRRSTSRSFLALHGRRCASLPKGMCRQLRRTACLVIAHFHPEAACLTVSVCGEKDRGAVVLAVTKHNLLDWLVGLQIKYERETIDEKIVVLKWNGEVVGAIQMYAASSPTTGACRWSRPTAGPSCRSSWPDARLPVRALTWGRREVKLAPAGRRVAHRPRPRCRQQMPVAVKGDRH